MKIPEPTEENLYRAYPFKENSVFNVIKPWMLLDVLLIDPRSDVSRPALKCSGISVSGSTASLKMDYYGADGVASTINIPIEEGTGITVGTVANEGVVLKFATFGGGSLFRFDIEDGEYAEDCEVLESRILAIPRKCFLRTFAGATGTIHVKDGYNTRMRIVSNRILVDVGKGLGNQDAACEDGGQRFVCDNVLQFVNGQHADTDGSIVISGGDGVSVQSGRNAVVDGKIVPAITMRVPDPSMVYTR